MANILAKTQVILIDLHTLLHVQELMSELETFHEHPEKYTTNT